MRGETALTKRLPAAAVRLFALVTCGGALAVGCGGTDTPGAGAGSGGAIGTSAAGGASVASGAGGADVPAGSGGAASPGAASGGTGGDTASSGTTDGGDQDGSADGSGPIYANVNAVMVSGTASAYTFNVTIESADTGCTQYADYWEVLRPDGTLVYRRILDHSHTDANGTTDPGQPGNTFTRDGGPVAVAAADVVIVRAHMNNGGYNGQVMRGSAAAGFNAAPDITSSFASGVQSQPPQPTTCAF